MGANFYALFVCLVIHWVNDLKSVGRETCKKSAMNITLGGEGEFGGCAACENSWVKSLWFSRFCTWSKVGNIKGPQAPPVHFIIIMKQCKRLQLQVVLDVTWSLSEQVTRSFTMHNGQNIFKNIVQKNFQGF